MRKLAQSSFEKDFWKLSVNAVFGKSMENLRNRVDVRLISDRLPAMKMAAKPNFVTSRIINEDLVMMQQIKGTITMDRPIYTGFCILELSKMLMYDFHYNTMMRRYGPDRLQLLFTDTDSLTYKITTDDLFEDMKANIDAYDTSNFDKNRLLYRDTNEKVLGKFKSETGSLCPSEFVGLRAKMYSLKISDHDKPKITAKGIKKSFASKHVTHDQFLKTLETKEQTLARFRNFRSSNHTIETLEISKICLAAFDDKRYIKDDGISSWAYGHKDIPRRSPDNCL